MCAFNSAVSTCLLRLLGVPHYLSTGDVGGFKRTRITVLVCYSLDLQCIPRTSMLKMLLGHWGMVETYGGEVSWEEAKSWLLGPPRE